MPRMSKLETFTINVKARLSQRRCGTTLNVLDDVIIIGCFHRNHGTHTEGERAAEAANYIAALKALRL